MSSTASARTDVRELVKRSTRLEEHEVRSKLVPVLRQAGEPLAQDPAELTRHLDRMTTETARRLTEWSDAEVEFSMPCWTMAN